MTIIRELRRTESIIGALIGLHWEGSLYEQLDARSRFENTIFSIKDFFKAESLLQPIIILIEDIHWLDEASQKVFERLSRNIDDFPMIILASSRFNDDDSKPTLKVDKEILQNELILKNLSSKNISELIKECLTYPASDDLYAFILSKTSGNPFYIEQYCEYFLENNLLEFEKGKYILKGEISNLPDGINAILIARIDRLSLELKRIMQTASVIGREFDIQILSAMLKGEEIETLLLEGENQRLWIALSVIKYIFKHTLLREAVYEMQLKARLRDLHKLAAIAIEELYKDDEIYYSDLAYHYEKAMVKDKTIEYLEKAGNYAQENYKNEEAINYYDQLLKLLGDENKEKRINVLLQKGDILELIGKWDSALDIYHHSLKLSEEIDNKILIGNSKNGLGALLREKGDYKTSFTLFKEALEIFTELDDKDNIIQAMIDIGQLYYNQGNYKEAMKYYEKTIQISEELGKKEYINLVIKNIGNVSWAQGKYDKAMEYYQKKIKIAEKLNDKISIGHVISDMGAVYWTQGNYEKAMECFQKFLEIAEELGYKQGISVAVGNMGAVYWTQGNYEKAMECYQRFLGIAEELGDKRSISIVMGNIGNIYKARNKYEKAMEYYEEKLKIAEELNDKLSISVAIGNIGNVYLIQGNYKKAMECYQKHLKISEELSDKRNICIASHNMGKVYKKLNKYTQAEKHYNEAIIIAKELKLKPFLCLFLYNKADLCFILKRYSEAKKLNEETMNIAKEINNQDIFKTCILHFQKVISLMYILSEEISEISKTVT